jgi:hypothetical protein
MLTESLADLRCSKTHEDKALTQLARQVHPVLQLSYIAIDKPTYVLHVRGILKRLDFKNTWMARVDLNTSDWASRFEGDSDLTHFFDYMAGVREDLIFGLKQFYNGDLRNSRKSCVLDCHAISSSGRKLAAAAEYHSINPPWSFEINFYSFGLRPISQLSQTMKLHYGAYAVRSCSGKGQTKNPFRDSSTPWHIHLETGDWYPRDDQLNPRFDRLHFTTWIEKALEFLGKTRDHNSKVLEMVTNRVKDMSSDEWYEYLRKRPKLVKQFISAFKL